VSALPNTTTRRDGPLLRLWLWLQVWNLRWNIESAEVYMAECERDGIMDSQTLRHWRDCMAAERCELATLLARLS
jgi:hypothetical protein